MTAVAAVKPTRLMYAQFKGNQMKLWTLVIVVILAGCGRTELFDRELLDTQGGPDYGTTQDAGDVGTRDDGTVDTDVPIPGDGKFGDSCTTGADCESGICRTFNDSPICTVPCDSTCPEPGFVCFESVCTPDDYCSADRQGPGCIVSCDQCDPNADCGEAENGGLVCSCRAGFSGNGRTCDPDECLDMPCSEDATCTDQVPGYSCVCNQGWQGDGLICDDIDECADFADSCSINATCVNTLGGFDCTCLPGFTGNGINCGDVNECAQNPCGAGTCNNLAGGYECMCPSGMTFDGVTCVGADACALGLDNCNANATCVPTINGFTCTCNAGFSGDGVTCVPDSTCQPACGSHAICSMSNRCECESGFAQTGNVCADIDECTTNTDNCSADAICTNTLGSFSCACKTGYTGNGVVCVDINECMRADACGPLQTCTNTPGGFTCGCAPGTVSVGNRCVLRGDVCEAPFVVTALPLTSGNNTTGFVHDYRFQGGQCPGVNGGRGGNTPDQVWAFTPTVSGWYQVDVNGQQNFPAIAYVVTDCSAIGSSCVGASDFGQQLSIAMTAGTTYYIMVDSVQNLTGNYTIDISVDECASGTDNCDPNATCEDTLNGFTCTCPNGFTGDGTTCTDLDECATNLAGCDPNATCTNTPGSFTCTCNAGYQGNGLSCYDGTAPGETCSNPYPITTMPYTYTGNTLNANNDFSVGFTECPGAFGGGGDASDDEVFSFTPTVNGTYRFEVSSQWQALISVRTACTSSSACLGAGIAGFNQSAAVDVTLLANVTYFIFVDGLGRTNNFGGPYTLTAMKL